MIYDKIKNIALYKGLSDDIYAGLKYLKDLSPTRSILESKPSSPNTQPSRRTKMAMKPIRRTSTSSTSSRAPRKSPASLWTNCRKLNPTTKIPMPPSMSPTLDANPQTSSFSPQPLLFSFLKMPTCPNSASTPPKK